MKKTINTPKTPAARKAQKATAPVTMSVQLARRAGSILAASKARQKAFMDEADWYADRAAQWSHGSIRVGLIGITSVGKSTLINALMGVQALPTGVRPTSNNLVLCRRQASRQAVVHFHGGAPKEVVKGTWAQLSARLDALTNEDVNRGNEADVAEIMLGAPEFLFDEEVVLVDTPGLDAFGHEKHETLTLKSFLPTVDMVIFLGTVKANSDAEVSRYLQMIHEAGKPVLFVQNMLDTLRPKFGAGGVVVRDEAMIASEHAARAERILSATLPEEAVRPVVQVSARWALDGKSPKASGLRAMKRAVRDECDTLRPRFERERRRQLRLQIKQLIEREERLGEDLDKAISAEEAALRRITRPAKETRNRMEQTLGRCGRQRSADFKRLKRDTRKVFNEDDFRALHKRLRDLVERDLEELRQVQDKTLNGAKVSAASLNLREEDIRKSPLSLQTPRRVTPPERTTQATRRKIPGFFGFMIRRLSLGGMGYEVVPGERVFDRAEGRKLLNSVCDASNEMVNDASSTLQDALNDTLGTIDAEVKRRQLALKARQHERICPKDSKKLLAELRKVLADAKDHDLATRKRRARGERPTAAERDARAWRSARAAYRASESENGKQLMPIYSAAAMRGADLTRWDIVAWDTHESESFAALFSHGDAAGHTSRGDRGVTVEHHAGLSCASSLARESHKGQPPLTFVLLDMVGVGATRSALARCNFEESARGRPVVAVLQGVGGLEDNGALPDALVELKRWMEDGLLGDVIGVLVNDPNPIYSELSRMLLGGSASLETVGDELPLYQRLEEEFAQDAVALRRCLAAVRQWTERIAPPRRRHRLRPEAGCAP